MPSTVERIAFETARAATEIAIAEAVQESETPIRMPAPIMTLTSRGAGATATRPAI